MSSVECGDGRAVESFDSVYASERLPMLRLAYLVVGASAPAEDIVHDSFAELLTRWDVIDVPGAYLRRSVLNRCLSWKRRDRVENAYASRQLAVSSASPDESLWMLLARLPAEQRAAIVCIYYLDMTSEDAATAIGTRPATVRTWVRRGLATIRKEMQ